MYHVIINAGIDPAIAYAFRRTGFLLTEENEKHMTAAELAEWDAAIEEYRSNKGPVHEASIVTGCVQQQSCT